MSVTLITSLILILGCTQENNPIGIEDDPDKKPIVIEVDFPFITQLYCYQESVGSSAPNVKLITGTFRENTSITLLEFSNLPDSGFIITDDVEPTLKIGIKGKYNAAGMKLALAPIKQEWEEDEATWSEAAEEDLWIQDWNNISEMKIIDLIEFTDEDSIVFIIPKETLQELVESWVINEPEGYGIAIFAEDTGTDGYIEFHAKDDDEGPKLSFSFIEAENRNDEDEYEEYDMSPVNNTFINSAKRQADLLPDNMFVIGNIPPTRTAFKLDVDAIKDSIMTRESVTEEELAKYFFNRVELILCTDDERNHLSPSETSLKIRALHISGSDMVGNQSPPRDELEATRPPSEYIADSDGVTIIITSLLQSYITGLKPNNGIVITPTVEFPNNVFAYADNRDNTYLVFHGNEATEDKRPRLRITYTKPPF